MRLRPFILHDAGNETVYFGRQADDGSAHEPPERRPGFPGLEQFGADRNRFDVFRPGSAFVPVRYTNELCSRISFAEMENDSLESTFIPEIGGVEASKKGYGTILRTTH